MISRHSAKTVIVTVHVITSVGMLVVTAALVAIQLQGSKAPSRTRFGISLRGC